MTGRAVHLTRPVTPVSPPPTSTTHCDDALLDRQRVGDPGEDLVDRAGVRAGHR
jgi:hypothetical protein